MAFAPGFLGAGCHGRAVGWLRRGEAGLSWQQRQRQLQQLQQLQRQQRQWRPPPGDPGGSGRCRGVLAPLPPPAAPLELS
jgi:hypothetical protein